MKIKSCLTRVITFIEDYKQQISILTKENK